VNAKARLDFKPGSRLAIREAGAGGYGDPRKRDPQAVLADVQNGFVSVAGAKRDYGVAVDLKRGIAIRRRARG
jgi:N-methylhydantoinase B